MTAWELYWLIKLDAIGNVLIATTVVFGAATAVLLIAGIVQRAEAGYYREGNNRTEYVSNCHRMGKALHKCLFLSVPLLVISSTVVALLPTTKQMCAIIVVPKVINAATESEALKAIPGKVLNLADEWLDKLSPSEATQRSAPLEEGPEVR